MLYIYTRISGNIPDKFIGILHTQNFILVARDIMMIDSESWHQMSPLCKDIEHDLILMNQEVLRKHLVNLFGEFKTKQIESDPIYYTDEHNTLVFIREQRLYFSTTVSLELITAYAKALI